MLKNSSSVCIIYQLTHCNIREVFNIPEHWCDNLKCDKTFIFIAHLSFLVREIIEQKARSKSHVQDQIVAQQMKQNKHHL